jgi:hypothetical protein
LTVEIADAPDARDGMFFRNSQIRFADVSDGTTYTLAVGERPAMFTQTPWAGAINGGTARITRGAATTSTGVEEAQVLPLAHTGSHTLDATDADPDDFSTPHVGIAEILFADGSVRPLPSKINLAILQALSTRSGSEVVPADLFRRQPSSQEVGHPNSRGGELLYCCSDSGPDCFESIAQTPEDGLRGGETLWRVLLQGVLAELVQPQQVLREVIALALDSRDQSPQDELHPRPQMLFVLAVALLASGPGGLQPSEGAIAECQ